MSETKFSILKLLCTISWNCSGSLLHVFTCSMIKNYISNYLSVEELIDSFLPKYNSRLSFKTHQNHSFPSAPFICNNTKVVHVVVNIGLMSCYLWNIIDIMNIIMETFLYLNELMQRYQYINKTFYCFYYLRSLRFLLFPVINSHKISVLSDILVINNF